MAQTELICPTHDALLDVAERLFARKGFASVGTREIAQEAGVNIASINYHFGSKNELYLATVRRAMGRRETQEVWEPLRNPPPDVEEAAFVFARFVDQFLAKLLPDDGSDSCCCLMLREAVEPTEALDAVVRDYMQPHMDLLMQLLAIVSPTLKSDPKRRRLAALSVLGQMLYHRIALPFLKRMQEQSSQAPVGRRDVAEHIARFSLTAIGCPDGVIEQAVAGGPAPKAAAPARRSRGTT